MRKPVSICSGVAVVVAVLVLLGCLRPRPTTTEKSPEDAREEQQGGRFDPLDLPQDREIVPLKHPQQDAIGIRSDLVDASDTLRDTTVQAVLDLLEATDTLSSQVYRVQLLTSTLYGEARHAMTIAREIFDRPVYLDYEVPYFKVRVGSFATREEAEDYQQRARTAGYPEAWVVIVNVGVKRTAPLYPEELEPAVHDSTGVRETYGPDEQ
jgi:hypothetical protein